MKKHRTSSRGVVAPAPRPPVAVQIPLPLLAALKSARQGFLDLCVATGRDVLEKMMETDRTQLCGPAWAANPERTAYRGGSAPSEVTLGGRRIPVRRLRARSRDGDELSLPSFLWAADRDPLDRHTLEAVAVGVSTRNYARSLEALGDEASERSVSRSAVSRRFVALSSVQLAEFLGRSLGDLDLRVVMIDGLHFRDHVLLLALGIAEDGRKHVLALREGSTENATVARELIADLIDRGLPTDRPILFVIDGSKALRKAIAAVFGRQAVVQRCQVHKLRNVLEHLPETRRASVSRALHEAWNATDVALAERRLRSLASGLDAEHPGAAASLREGLEETLTLQRLGIGGALYRTLRSTNAIENLNGLVGHFVRNVRRWQGGKMLERWIAAAICEASGRFRRLRGHAQMRELTVALAHRGKHTNLDTTRKAA